MNILLHKDAIGLKNDKATYQRMVNKIFDHQIGRNMKVYVDDGMINMKTVRDHISDLEDVFTIIQCYEMHLNLKKYIFGVMLCKYLGYLVSS